jgi:cytochrome c553
MKHSKTLVLLPLALAPIIVLSLAGSTRKQAQLAGIQRGKYLVETGHCTECHTPHKMGPHGPEPDMTRYLAGHAEDVHLPSPPALPPGPWCAVTTGSTAWSGPWGISYSANLTPDVNTGLGIWTEDIFLKAMKTGKHFGTARDILPPMPWQSISKLTDDDLKAMFAYLQTIPAVKNRVLEPVPPGGPTTAQNQ